jgi:hydroxymethylpyrimidine/phosphomethylpyrimidine kinase
MSAITALTAQNTTGVSGIHPVPPAFAVAQLEAIFSDIGADAVKIGMLYSAELVEAVAETLKKYGVKKVVLDPVMVAQSGDKLLQDDAVAAIKTSLAPLATVITPNIPEAAVMLGCKEAALGHLEQAARSLACLRCSSVLLKGGHRDTDDSTDILYLAEDDRTVILKDRRVSTRNTHGTGCTLSSAIAAYLAKGAGIEEAVRSAKVYISRAIRAGAGYRLGHGHGPVHHFFEYWQ